MASTVTAFSDMAPSPRAVIDIDDADLDPSCVTAQVMQVSQWGSVPVENTPRTVAGGFVVYDYTIPAGVSVVYKVRQFNAAGADIGLVLSIPVEVEIPFGKVVLSDPFAPAAAVVLDGEAQFAGQRGKSRPTKIYQAGTRSFAMSGLASAMQQVNLSCYTDTVDDADALAELLDQPIVLVRTHPRTGLPGSFYASVPSFAPDSTDHARFGRDTNLWVMSGSEVSRPTVDVLVPIYSYDLYKEYLYALYPPTASYGDAASEWSTYIDAIRNPPSLV